MLSYLGKGKGSSVRLKSLRDNKLLGGTSTALPNNADLNNYRTPGLYTFSATSQSIANAPTGLYSCIMRVSTMTGQVVWQEILSGGGILYHRSYGVSSQTWNPWVRNDNYGTTSLSELASALGATGGVLFTADSGGIAINLFREGAQSSVSVQFKTGAGNKGKLYVDGVTGKLTFVNQVNGNTTVLSD